MKAVRFLRLLLLLCIIAFAALSAGTKTIAKPQHKTVYVYISLGPAAVCYHSSPYCSGLSTSSAKVVRIPLDSAKNRRPCRICYKKHKPSKAKPNMPNEPKKPKKRSHRSSSRYIPRMGLNYVGDSIAQSPYSSR